MPLTLRQHYARAMEILSCLGGPTILPSPANAVIRRRRRRKIWMRNPKPPNTRPDVAGNRRDYALSVKIACEASDRTGWMVRYLEASDEAASSVWHEIPDLVVCFDCRVQRRRAGRWQQCPKCGRKMVTYSGVVGADLRYAIHCLRMGGIGVA